MQIFAQKKVPEEHFWDYLIILGNFGLINKQPRHHHPDQDRRRVHGSKKVVIVRAERDKK